MRDHNTSGMNNQSSFNPMRHQQPQNNLPSSSSEYGRRKSAPIIPGERGGSGADPYHHHHRRRHRSPHHHHHQQQHDEERFHQRQRYHPSHYQHPAAVSVPPLPPKLSIAEQFMSSSSSRHNNVNNLEQQYALGNKKEEPPSTTLRLSIAEQFMIKKKQPVTVQGEEEEALASARQHNNNNNNVSIDNNSDEKNQSSILIRSSSGFSRLLSSFHLDSNKNNNNNMNDGGSKVSIESVSTPSSDGRPVAKFDPHHRQQYDLQHQRSTVRPYHRPKCYCQCDHYPTSAKPNKYLDIIEEKSSYHLKNHHHQNKKNFNNQEDEEEKASTTSAMTNSTCRRKHKRRTICVITTFIILIAGAITLFLTWPRTPLFRIDGATLIDPPTLSETHQHNMNAADNVAFESTWSLMATLDNRQNFIPLHFSMETIVKASGTIIGRSSNTATTQQRQNVVLSPRTISQIDIPVHIDYEARQSSDPIFSSLRRACVENSHQGLQLQFWITLHIAGLEWTGYHPSIVATPATGGFLCPMWQDLSSITAQT